ncbi:endonuclease/exonuclease/phosphatase family protein [archaeon]|jgi:endonuclease/exonuclease/phosphatase family metal-dependent hydrolase|nr:endonuclease/exonuclease/phosphatase family protein [archaeon]
MVKILNLNLFNYVDFDKRKPKIIKFIKKHDPDIIVFQEVRDDLEFNKKGDNQLKQLNRELNYPHSIFYPVTDKRKERPGKYKKPCIEGTGILSKFKILKSEKKKLKKHEEDIYNCGNLYLKIKAEKVIDLIVVHFSNRDLFSLLHLIETLKEIKKRKINPIIVGDFNMRHPEYLRDLTEEKYKISYYYKKYISYPAAKYTLDYIVIPKKYKFKSFKCLGKGLSDHKALVAEVAF